MFSLLCKNYKFYAWSNALENVTPHFEFFFFFSQHKLKLDLHYLSTATQTLPEERNIASTNTTTTTTKANFLRGMCFSSHYYSLVYSIQRSIYYCLLEGMLSQCTVIKQMAIYRRRRWKKKKKKTSKQVEKRVWETRNHYRSDKSKNLYENTTKSSIHRNTLEKLKKNQYQITIFQSMTLINLCQTKSYSYRIVFSVWQKKNMSCLRINTQPKLLTKVFVIFHLLCYSIGSE